MSSHKKLLMTCMFVLAGTVCVNSMAGDCPEPDGCPSGPSVQPATYIQQHIVVNNVWYAYTDDLCPYGGQNGIVNIQGHWVWAGMQWDQYETQCDKVRAFINITQKEVEDRLEQYFNNFQNHPNAVPYDTDGIVILDMEQPVHPKHLWQYCNGEIHGGYVDPEDVVDAWKMRIAVAKAAFPNATIAMYGTIVPNAQGNCGTTYQ